MAESPSGTVTFLFTDIEGSTERWDRDQATMAQAVERQVDLLRAAVTAHHGVLFKVVGDAVQAAFTRPWTEGRRQPLATAVGEAIAEFASIGEHPTAEHVKSQTNTAIAT